MKTKNKWRRGELVEHLLKLIENKEAYIAALERKHEGNDTEKPKGTN